MIKLYLLFPLFLNISYSSFSQKQGQPRIDSLLDHLTGYPASKHQVNLYNDLSFTYYSVNAVQGIHYGKRALELAEELKWDSGIADANQMIGMNYYSISDYTQALNYFKITLKLVQKLNYLHRKADVLGRLSIIYNEQGDYPKAMELALMSMKISEENGFPACIANACYDLGAIYNIQGDSAKALEYYKRALIIFKDINHKDGEANTINDIGTVYAFYELDTSFSFFQKALQLNQSLGLNRNVARNFANIGVYYMWKKEYAKALDYTFRSTVFVERVNDKRGMATNLANLGFNYLEIAKDSNNKQLPDSLRSKNKVLQKSISCLHKAIKISEDAGLPYFLMYLFESLSEAEAMSGNYQEALNSYRKHSTLKDSIFSTESNKKLKAFEIEEEGKIKQSQIKVQSLQLATAKKEKIGLFSGLVLWG